jgi:hypothetical protein
MKPTNRDGFALPMTILVIGLLTAGIMAAYARSDSEHRVIQSGVRQVDAYMLAQAGLDQALLRRRVSPDSQRFVLDGGAADVMIRLIRPEIDTIPPLYLLRSRGMPAAPTAPGLPRAQHVAVQFAYFERGDMNVVAGWASLTGLDKNGGAGTISGFDEASPRCRDGQNVAGVAVPTGGYTQDGGTSVPAGDPPIDNMGTPEQMRDEIDIDWDGIINGNAIVPDITVPPSSFPSSVDFDSRPNWWPVIRVNASLTVDPPQSGRGTLIIAGDLVMNGNFTWDGVILVGGRIISNGYQEVRGTTYSGLNTKLGMAVGASAIGNGNKIFRYHSCNVENALSAFSTLRPVRNAWADNWLAY